MNEIFNIPYMKSAIKACSKATQKGWHERNGGNFSYRLATEDIERSESFFDYDRPFVPLGIRAETLGNSYLLASNTGVFLGNIETNPFEGLCVVRLNRTGDAYQIVYGSENHKPTSELASHILNHSVKIRQGDFRVIYHAHPESVIALTFLLPLTPRAFSNVLWRSISECVMVFPKGVGVLDWMIPGSDEIARASAKMMELYDILIWANHGIFAAGKTFDDAVSLIETVEKSAKIYLLYKDSKVRNIITNANLIAMAEAMHLPLNRNLLDEAYDRQPLENEESE